MPWTTADVDRHKKGLNARQKRQWVEVANSALKRCTDDGGSQSACEASAIRQANSVVGNNSSQYTMHHVQANNYTIRTETHQGKKHLVVPVIMMVEGVHAGSHGPLLHLAEDLGRFPEAWNGIPIAIDHPADGEQFISANSPNVIDRQTVGRVYNTQMAEGKLKAEAWIEEEKISRLSPAALGYIRQGHPLDVSVGVFTEDEMSSGVWNNESYDGIARNHRPDHLALLPGGQGACSWEDGCGIRANEALATYALRYSGTETTAWTAPTLSDFNVDSSRWEDLSQSEKAKVASHFLIGSANAETFGDLKLPVVNPRTGKLNERVLRAVIGGRGAQVGGVSAAQRSAARRRAYSLLNSEFDAGLEIPNNLSEGGNYNVNLLNAMKELNLAGFSAVQINEQGYKEVISVLQSKLDRMDDDVKVHFLQEVYDGYCIYEVRFRAVGDSNSLYRRNYRKNSDGSVEFTGEPVAVQRKVEYITMKKGDLETMADKDKNQRCPKCIEKAGLLIQNKHSTFQEADREWLETLEEAYLDKLLGMQRKDDEPPQVNKEQAIQVLQDELKTPDKFINLLSGEMKDQMQYSFNLYQEQKNDLVKKIADYAKDKENPYTEEDLKTMSMKDLQKLASLIPVKADYSLKGDPTAHDKGVAPMPPPGVIKEEKK